MEFGNMLSSLQFLTGFILLICVLYNVAMTVASSDFVSVQRKPGKRDIMIRLSGIAAMETATGEGVGLEINFIYREATDGTHLVQAVYDDNYELKNCQMTDDEEKIRDLMVKQHELSLAQLSKRFLELQESDDHQKTSQHHKGHDTRSKVKIDTKVFTKSDLELDSIMQQFQYSNNATDSLFFHYNGPVEELPYPANTMLNIEKMKEDCEVYNQMVLDNSHHHQQEQDRSGGKYLGPSSPSSSSSTTTTTTTNTTSSDVQSREKRGLSFTWPGTMWCGKGTTAESFSQLGEHAFADRCCRDHDHCPMDMLILGRETKYHLFNRYFFTLSHCKCDKKFHQCLKQASTTVSNEVGHTYFNRFSIQCFVFKEKEQCVEKSWWGKCTKYATVQSAVIRDGHAFPKSAKRQAREAEMSVERALEAENKTLERAKKQEEAMERRHNKTMAKEARILQKEEAALRKATKLAEREEQLLNNTAKRVEREQNRLRKEMKLAEREERQLNKTMAAEARQLQKDESAKRKEAKQAAAEERRLQKEASELRKELKQAEATERRLNKTLAAEARRVQNAEAAERRAARRAAAEIRRVRKAEEALRKEAQMVANEEQQRKERLTEEEQDIDMIEMRQAALRQEADTHTTLPKDENEVKTMNEETERLNEETVDTGKHIEAAVVHGVMMVHLVDANGGYKEQRNDDRTNTRGQK